MWDLATPFALLLLPLPLLARHVLPPFRHMGGALHLPETVSAHFFDAGSDARSSSAPRRMLPWLLWVVIVAALAGPRAMVDAPHASASGRDIILALDLSGSMLRRDFEIDGVQVSRIDALKKVAKSFIRGRTGDRVGLVIFAEEAYAVSPPSFDIEAVSRLVDEMTVGLVGRSTAIGDGLGLALKRLAASDARTRVVVLLSDGANDAGATDPVEVARLAHTLGIRIYTIALGLNDLAGGTNDPDAVDAATLQKMAELSGGTTFRARTTDDLEQANRSIEVLETSPAKAPPRILYQELWIYPASLAFFLAMMLSVERRSGP